MSSAPYDLHRCLIYLRPGATFSTTDNDYALTDWQDPRPMPTNAECADAWLVLQAQDEASANASATAAANASTMDSNADQALASLRAYRDAASPAQAQTVAIVKVICRVLIALIRFRLNKLDGAD